MSNGEESPTKRRRFTFLMLPDDLVLNCLARVSRSYYSTLSLVSKRLRSFLISTELYQTRTLLDRTESCLYVCLKTPRRLFTLSRIPNSSRKVLVPISSPDSLPNYLPDVVLVGPDIYVMGGEINESASSSVMVMDCRSHTWQEAPSMQVARVFPSACVLDGKIYVVGGCKNLDKTNWMEVFHTKTQTWEFAKGPMEKICKEDTRYESIWCNGDMYVRRVEKDGMFKLHKGRWRAEDMSMNKFGDSSSHFVIDNVLFHCSTSMICWYDSELRCWKKVMGLDHLFPICRYNRAIAANYGGKMAVLWQGTVCDDNYHKVTQIWCATIRTERSQDGEIWGTPEWFDVVYTTYEPFGLLSHVFAATL